MSIVTFKPTVVVKYLCDKTRLRVGCVTKYDSSVKHASVCYVEWRKKDGGKEKKKERKEKWEMGF